MGDTINRSCHATVKFEPTNVSYVNHKISNKSVYVLIQGEAQGEEC